MALKVRIFVIVVMVLILLKLFRLMGKKRIDFKYGLSWSLVDIMIIIVAAWPSLLAWLARLTGVIAPVNMLFFLGFILALAIIFSLSVTVSKLQDRVSRLSQEIAILRKDQFDSARKMEEKIEAETKSEA